MNRTIGQGVQNKNHITTLYIPPDKNHIWIRARFDALKSKMSLSQYVLGLIEKDQQKRDLEVSTPPIGGHPAPMGGQSDARRNS